MSAEDVLVSVLTEVGLEKQTPQVTSSDVDIVQIVEYMNQAGKDIATRAEWSQLFKTDTTAGSVSSHTLPSDFREMAESGAVYLNKSDWQPVRMVVDPVTWAFINSRNSATRYCHLSGGALLFAPALDSDGAKYTYLSNNWVSDNKSKITTNADTFLIPERLIRGLTVVLWLREKGIAYDDQLAEFEANLLSDVRADRGQM